MARSRKARHIGGEVLVDEPHGLIEALLRELVAELGHPLDQVALGDQHIDGKLRPQDPHQLVDPPADTAPVLLQRLGRRLEQLVGRDGHDQAVERLLLPVLDQEVQELLPLLLVLPFVDRDGVPPGRIEDDRLLEEPPVAVPGSRNAGGPVHFRKGEERRALLIAVVFPEPLSPITMYQGRT